MSKSRLASEADISAEARREPDSTNSMDNDAWSARLGVVDCDRVV